MTDFYSQNRCVCSTRSHGRLLCAFCLSFHFNIKQLHCKHIKVQFNQYLSRSIIHSNLSNVTISDHLELPN